MHRTATAILFALISLLSALHATERDRLQSALCRFAAYPDARIGIAVITDRGDTVSVCGNTPFPMLSVYKFPQAIALTEFCESRSLKPSSRIEISSTSILPDTWSPLRDHYGIRHLSLPLDTLLAYSLQLSDNNACDILFGITGGPLRTDSIMKAIGLPDIRVISTEEEMHADSSLCYANSSTPLAMAALMNRFFTDEATFRSPMRKAIAKLMYDCTTGKERLAAGLSRVSPEAAIAHKTGTGDTNADGKIIAVNDAAYITLPSGRSYSIAVFIADSGKTIAETEETIAEISEAVCAAIASPADNSTPVKQKMPESLPASSIFPPKTIGL